MQLNKDSSISAALDNAVMDIRTLKASILMKRTIIRHSFFKYVVNFRPYYDLFKIMLGICKSESVVLTTVG